MSSVYFLGVACGCSAKEGAEEQHATANNRGAHRALGKENRPTEIPLALLPKARELGLQPGDAGSLELGAAFSVRS